jgi:2-dehydro-3-deoxyphosphogluconate aldolase/(4S)-4-hydroxy-2-oxoglutarate aldolase
MHPDETGAAIDQFASTLRRARIVPVLRARTAQAAIAAAARCVGAGLNVVELTTTTLDWEHALEQSRREHPDRLIGMGTVLNADQARRALDAGADFIVSPCPAPEVRAEIADAVPFLEGGMTVREVLTAASRGIAKLFPAHVGGPAFVRSLLAVSPESRIVPTGGIALRDAATWLAAGAIAVGVGSDLLAADDMAVEVTTALAELDGS